MKTRSINIDLSINEAARLYHAMNSVIERTDIETDVLEGLGMQLTKSDLGILTLID